ncbi:MAG TPA: gephyrin-like molybdotransferase Glp [Candidatus Acidoferrales bacterium]|nr:gephyrin-like molybdotransferase Glp [Candidatus Acidoferrales bacterium]
MEVLANAEAGARTQIAFPEARAMLLAAVKPLEAQRVPLLAANGRTAAFGLRASEDIVPFARSAMDGFALRASETLTASRAEPLRLRVIGGTYAGDNPTSLPAHRAVTIATGAALPAGADAVVPFEVVELGRHTITLFSPLASGENVFAPGEDAKRGDILVRAGDVLTPGRVALLAAGGYTTVAVHRRPRIALVSTGNEIVSPDEKPKPGQIRNSNSAMLAAYLEHDGADVVFIEHASDTETAVRTTLECASRVSDLVIITGGASAGERDLVKGVLRTLGASFFFDSVALRPARPTGFARLGECLVAVLPGNPAAAHIAYVALVRGIVRRFAGHSDAYRAAVPAMLDGVVERKERHHCLSFGTFVIRGESLSVTPLVNQCSSRVRTSAEANALIVVEPGSGYLLAGHTVPVEVLDWNAVPIAHV